MVPERTEEEDRETERAQKDRGTTLHRVCGVWLKAGCRWKTLVGAGSSRTKSCWLLDRDQEELGKQEEWSGGHDPGRSTRQGASVRILCQCRGRGA